MDTKTECEVCRGPGSLGDEDGRVLCVPCRRGVRRAGVRSTVVSSVPKHYERGPRRQVPHELHGEVNVAAAAVIGQIEGRTGRGVPLHEAAQVVLLVLAILEQVTPGADLFSAVVDEIERLEQGEEAGHGG